MVSNSWNSLPFWKSGEYQVIKEKLSSLDKAKKAWCPGKKNLFAALEAVKPEDVRVMIVGQDPYPGSIYATGIAFSIPEDIKEYPPTLINIFKEYQDDLHYPAPKNGSLLPWCEQGVLLWNARPSCDARVATSHDDWWEYDLLNQQILEELRGSGVFFCFLGKKAAELSKHLRSEAEWMQLSHPSPLGATAKNNPFLGSRMFTTINTKLHNLGKGFIDWKLP